MASTFNVTRPVRAGYPAFERAVTATPVVAGLSI